MTAQEINNYFDLLYNNSTNYEGAGFSAKEKSLLLTYAQEQVIEKYLPIAETKELYKRYLLPLKNHGEIDSILPSNNYPNSTGFNTSSYRILYIISEWVMQEFNSNSPCYSAGTIRRLDKIKSITSDYYAANIGNPFKKPYQDLAWKLNISTTSVALIGDNTYSIPTYHFEYYKKPSPIIVPYAYTVAQGSILGESFASNTNGLSSEVEELHTEIVQEAVRIATSATKDQLGYQIQNLEKQL